ncbi:MAG TPA: potassium transporter TrkG [Tepidisphaeraceae bacterium]
MVKQKARRADVAPAAVIVPDRREGAVVSLWLGVAFFISLLAGFIILKTPGATIAGNELSAERAAFTTLNAGTLTGFQHATSLDLLGGSGKFALWMLTIVGTLFALVAGGLAVVRVASMPFSDRQVITGTITWYALSVFAGTALLADPTRPLLTATMQALSAFGNSGIVFGSLPGPADWRTHLVLLGLATLGGLSVPVLLDVSGAIFGRHRVTKHTSVVLAMTGLVYLLGLAACIPWQSITWSKQESWTSAVAMGSILSIDSRTAGLPLVSLAALTRVGQWLLVVLMIIGAAPGSAAGGLKVTTLYALASGTRRVLRGGIVPRIVGVAALWLGVYTTLVLASYLCLLAFQPELPADRLLFIAISAISCVGLSQDPISMTGGGLAVVCTAMFLGRILPVALLWWTATAFPNSEIAVG